jgi:hypothetical protein
MIDCFHANISHSYFFETKGGDAAAFIKKVRTVFPDAVLYSQEGENAHPYFQDMQTAENFLHGGGQTYDVVRFLLPKFSADLKKSEIAGWCVMLTYFEETAISGISFHYAVENRTTDQIIAYRQSGDQKKYSFADGEFSCDELAQKIAFSLGMHTPALERSYLCEITKFGDKSTVKEIEETELARLYSFISGDEGYEFIPQKHLEEQLKIFWESRDFIRIYADGKAFLFLNLLGSESHEKYLERQTQFGTEIYGAPNPYFFLGSCPLTVNHGMYFSIEFVMMLKALINDVLQFQSEFRNTKKISYYKRIRMTREFRRKIVMVLEKVDRVGIASIGKLSSVLMESQHIGPIVDQVKYLLELLEADLTLIYSERNDLLMTVLTVLGLVFAAVQILMAF